jgi:acyl carrier protein
MTESQVFEKVATLITPYAKNTEALKTLTNESKILEDLGVNSARLVDIVLAFEDEFDIEVEDEAADDIWTVGDAVKLINAKIQ